MITIDVKADSKQQVTLSHVPEHGVAEATVATHLFSVLILSYLHICFFKWMKNILRQTKKFLLELINQLSFKAQYTNRFDGMTTDESFLLFPQ